MTDFVGYEPPPLRRPPRIPVPGLRLNPAGH